MMYDELIETLRHCSELQDCFKCKYQYSDICKSTMARDAADAIERLTSEIDRKDKAIQGLLTQIESKDKSIERMRDLMKHYKAAYRTAYKLYQEERDEQQP